LPYPGPAVIKTRVAPFYAEAFFGNFSADLAIWSFFLTEVQGLSISEAVFSHTLIFLTIGLLDLPTGAWADMFGRRRILVCGYLSRIGGAALTMCSSSYAVILLASILTGFGWSQISGANRSWLYDNLKANGEEERFPVVFSNYWSIMFVARCLAFAGGGALFSLNPFFPYLMMVTSLGLTVAVMVLGNRELPFTRAVELDTRGQLRFGLRALSEIRGLRFIALLLIGISVASESAWVVLQPLFADLDLTVGTVGGIYAVGALVSALGSQLAKAPLFGRSLVSGFTLIAVLYAGAGMLLGTADRLSILFGAGIIAYHLAAGMTFPVFEPSLQMHIESSRRATFSSLLSTATNLTIGAVGFFLGWIVELAGAAWVFEGLAIAAGLLLAVAIQGGRRGVLAPRATGDPLMPGRTSL